MGETRGWAAHVLVADPNVEWATPERCMVRLEQRRAGIREVAGSLTTPSGDTSANLMLGDNSLLAPEGPGRASYAKLEERKYAPSSSTRRSPSTWLVTSSRRTDASTQVRLCTPEISEVRSLSEVLTVRTRNPCPSDSTEPMWTPPSLSGPPTLSTAASATDRVPGAGPPSTRGTQGLKAQTLQGPRRGHQ